MSELTIIETNDGSHSLRHESLQETYHSTHGAVQESLHVFIHHGVHHLIAQAHKPSLSILEIGFGTGLNALLTLRESIATQTRLSYTTVEKFPLSWALVNNLNYPAQVKMDRSDFYFQQLHEAKWEQDVSIAETFMLKKINLDILSDEWTPPSVDIVFFDAFAPSKQPDLWQLPVLEKIVQAILPGGVFVTYCAQGQLKRNLRSIGLIVESLPGPPGKREMVRALKPV